MKKIAVGDLGEFWYGDYKEPFEQLEGGVPGHPVGVLLKADDGKLLCAYCGKTYHNLGRHSHATHKMSAREYKQEVGLLQKSALVSEHMRMVTTATAKKRWATTVEDPRWGARRFGSEEKQSPAPRAEWTPEALNKTGKCYAQVLQVAHSIMRDKGRLSQKDMYRRGVHQAVIERYFGSIDHLRGIVGDTKIRPWVRWTNERIVDALRHLAADLGRTPSGSDLRRYGLMHSGTIAQRFGTYANACRLAGLDPNLPSPTDSDMETSALVAYASTGSMLKAAKVLGVSDDRIRAILSRYGYPYPPGYAGPGRREWAADMARRLAGVSNEQAVA